MSDLLGHSITYRIAIWPQAGRKAFTLQTVPAREQDNDNPNLAKAAGFPKHAGVAAKAHQRRKLECLCRYVARPAVATDRLALTPQGNVRYDVKGFTNVAGAGCAGATTLKTPYRDGTTHIILEPRDKCVGNVFERPKAGPEGMKGRMPGIIHRPLGRSGPQAARQPDPLCSYRPDTRPLRGPAKAVKIASFAP